MNCDQIGNNKRQRLIEEINNSQSNIDVSGMMLTDLDNDCLDQIFRYLSLADLSSVAETCKVLQDIAINTFKYIWKNEEAVLHNNTTKDKLDTLRILRQFGGSLQKVNIDFSDRESNEKFFHIIMKKRNLSLVHVKFSGFNTSCRLYTVLRKQNLYRFNERFNNLTSLRFGMMSDALVSLDCIEQTFPHLQHLSLQYPFDIMHLAKFISFNPQLKSLEFGLDFKFVNSDLMKLIDRRLPQLEELKLMEIDTHFAPVRWQSLFLKNLKRLTIRDMKSGKFLPNLSISNKKVEELNIEVNSCNDNLINTICQYKSIQKLSLNCLTNSFRGEDLIKFSKQLPKLSKLELRGYSEYHAMNNILQFIQESEYLTKLILLRFTSYIGDIKEKLDSAQWGVFQSHEQLRICRYTK